MLLKSLLKKYAELPPTAKATASFSVVMRAAEAVGEDRIVLGEVYAPYVIDSHGDMMLPEDVRLLAHRFMKQMKNDQIDVMHNNKIIKASAVESYIARDGDPLFNPGAWVMAVKIDDDEVWELCKRGEYGAYSFEAMVRREEADVELLIQNQIYGFTQKCMDHDHAFYATVNDEGVVTGGITSAAEDGHFHLIKYGTRTEKKHDHYHRFFMP